jgi:hypothetical protein
MRDLPRGTQVIGLRRLIAFIYGAVTLYGLPFLTGSTSDQLCNSAGTLQGPAADSYNPSSETAATYRAELGLGYSRFARHYSGNCLFSSRY